ncbi:hypothetical protein AGMMS50276_15380 [Synergistales bacterium]|nr:hypothetical protein AGMMS50276_15380 [Synergistales bacterium]
MRKILKFMDDHLEEYLAFALFTVMLSVLIVQVTLRYCFSKGLSWPEEMARYSFQWVIYLGISLAMKEDQHIRVDAILGLWPKKAREALCVISDLLLVGLAVYLVWGGSQYTLKIFRQGSFGTGFPIRLGFVYAAIPVGYALMCVRTCQKIYKSFIARLV